MSDYYYFLINLSKIFIHLSYQYIGSIDVVLLFVFILLQIDFTEFEHSYYSIHVIFLGFIWGKQVLYIKTHIKSCGLL